MQLNLSVTFSQILHKKARKGNRAKILEYMTWDMTNNNTKLKPFSKLLITRQEGKDNNKKPWNVDLQSGEEHH